MSQKKSQLNTRQKKILDLYFNKLSALIKIDGILLFGSFAYGKPTKHSDIDLIVLSKDFNKVNFFDRLALLSRSRKKVAENMAMDIIGYTPTEFRHIENESSILQKAKTDGVWLRK